MVIPREARRITYSTDIRDKKRIKLDEYQKAIIVGTILGDACLHENWSKTNYRLQIRHSIAQEAYVMWKYQALKALVLTKPQHYEKTNSVWFRTISHPELTQLQKVFYRDKKKIIPENIEQFLSNPLTIAVWFMDDGNVRKTAGDVKGYDLNTQSFTLSENQILQQALQNVWNIRATLNKNHKYYRLHLGVREIYKFANLIRKHILPSMEYKIGYMGDSSSPVETGFLHIAG